MQVDFATQKINISRKNAEGKFRTIGSLKLNKFNNVGAGFKVTPELKAFANEIIAAKEGDWINASAFVNDIEDANAPF